MTRGAVIETEAAKAIAAARAELLERLVAVTGPVLGLRSALDTSCGVGRPASSLHALGLDVVAFDRSQERVDEAQRRYKGIAFSRADVSDPDVVGIGEADLVVSFGALHHLENPFQALRNMWRMTKRILVVETTCMPGDRASLHVEDQWPGEEHAENYLGMYPTEPLLAKALFRSGCDYVYRLQEMPNHEDYRGTPTRHRTRTVLVATRVPLDVPGVEVLDEPRSQGDPWARRGAAPLLSRGRDWLGRPWWEKRRSLRLRGKHLANRFVPVLPLLVDEDFRGVWLAGDDTVGDLLWTGDFEPGPRRFVREFLQPGMIVVDAGAHQGYYTVMSSKLVGDRGQVLAFEPSPRERRRLHWHLRINRCSNVTVEPAALGAREGEADLFIVAGRDNGCNSLRRPEVRHPTRRVRVSVTTLDAYLGSHGQPRVDFMKVDVEGGELDLLRGARELMSRFPRPVIMCEAEDFRTAGWGYRSGDILEFLKGAGFHVFDIGADGRLHRGLRRASWEFGNVLAVPNERVSSMSSHICHDGDDSSPAKGHEAGSMLRATFAK